MDAIKFIPTKDLMEELLTRCMPAVFIGHKHEGEDGVYAYTQHSGDLEACFGLCHQMALKIQIKKMQSITGDE